MKKIGIGSIIVGAIFTVILMFAVVFASSNKRFAVEVFPTSAIANYEATPGYVEIQASPDVAWEKAPGILKAFGWIFFIVLWICIIYVALDKHQPKGSVQDNV